MEEDEIRKLAMEWCIYDWGRDEGAKGGVAMFGRGEWGVLAESGLMGGLVDGGLYVVGEGLCFHPISIPDFTSDILVVSYLLG